MATKRSYGEACRFAHALDVVGERWALLVVRELLLGPKRFTDLRAGLPQASTNILAERLRELEQGGVVRVASCRRRRRSTVYELTEWGRELEPIVTQPRRLGRPLALPARLAGDRRRLDRPRPALALRRRGGGRPRGELRAAPRRGPLPRRGRRRRARALPRRGRRIRRRRSTPTPPPSPRCSPASSRSRRRSRPGAVADRGQQAGRSQRFLRLFPMPEPCQALPIDAEIRDAIARARASRSRQERL